MQPILLLRWLDKPTSEISDALNGPAAACAIRWADVATRQELLGQITDWLSDNPNAQFLYIGCHGDREALFRSDKEPYIDRLTYTELASHLKQYPVTPISVWLGACDSSAAASAWSNTEIPVRYLLGFAKKVKEKLVVALLPELVSLTWNNPLSFDEEIDHIRLFLGVDHVQAFYVIEGSFVDVDRFELIHGMDLRTYLERRQNSREV